VCLDCYIVYDSVVYLCSFAADIFLHKCCICVADDVVNLMSWTMSLLLRARVNAALTIQLFSQLFHFVNQWLFNRLIAHNSTLCTRAVGQQLLRRLHRVELWAEKQGLELAAECHLARILQVGSLRRLCAVKPYSRRTHPVRITHDIHI